MSPIDVNEKGTTSNTPEVDVGKSDRLFEIEYVTNLSAQHKYFPALHKYKGKIDTIYEHPKKKGKLMLKLPVPVPGEPDKEAYISLKHIDILNASFRGITLYTIRQLMDKVVNENIKLPVRVMCINPFRETQFQHMLIMYASSKEEKVHLVTGKNQGIKPIDHLRQMLFVLAKQEEPKQLPKETKV